MIWEVEENMSANEFDLWLDWFILKEEIRKEEMNKAKREADAKSPRQPRKR